MRAWPVPEASQSCGHHSGSATRICPSGAIAIYPSLREQISSVLVSMILPQRSVQPKSANG